MRGYCRRLRGFRASGTARRSQQRYASHSRAEAGQFARAWELTQLELQVCPDDVHHGVDQGQVSEGLREIPQVPSGLRLDLLGVELEWAGVGEKLLAQPSCSPHLADLAQRRHQPERADRERPFLA